MLISNNAEELKSTNKFNTYNYIGSYLAGLIVGNISIINNKDTGSIISTVFDFTFHENNLALYVELKEFIGSGNIYRKGGETMRYVISDKKVLSN